MLDCWEAMRTSEARPSTTDQVDVGEQDATMPDDEPSAVAQCFAEFASAENNICTGKVVGSSGPLISAQRLARKQAKRGIDEPSGRQRQYDEDRWPHYMEYGGHIGYNYVSELLGTASLASVDCRLAATPDAQRWWHRQFGNKHIFELGQLCEDGVQLRRLLVHTGYSAASSFPYAVRRGMVYERVRSLIVSTPQGMFPVQGSNSPLIHLTGDREESTHANQERLPCEGGGGLHRVHHTHK